MEEVIVPIITPEEVIEMNNIMTIIGDLIIQENS